MSPVFCDAHNHLQDDRFAGRQDELIAAAAAVGVGRSVVNGAAESDWAAVSLLARLNPTIIPSFDYHPWYLHERTPHWQDVLTGWLDATPRSIIGEIGLDRWILEQTPAIRSRFLPELALREPTGISEQTGVFEVQWRLAARRNLPVSVHCLHAWGPLLACLRTWPRLGRGFLLHSYGGSAELIPELSRLGAYFGFPGYFLHERKFRQQAVFRQIPLDRILVETDAPDQMLPASLHPYPLTDPATGRELNHPANLPIVYAGLSSILGMPVADLAAQVSDNFSRIFGPSG